MTGRRSRLLLVALLGGCVRYGFGTEEGAIKHDGRQGPDTDAASVDGGPGERTLTDLPPADHRVVAPTPAWSKRLGGSQLDLGFSVATDAAGNLYATGAFIGPVDFGGGALIPNGPLENVFVASYTAAGQHRWSRSFGGGGWNWGHDVTVDRGGNVLVAGHYQGAMDPGGGSLPGTGAEDIFIVSYTSAGQYRWAKTTGGSDEDYGRGVAADASGNVYLTGDFVGSADFGGGPLSSADSALFVASFASAGQHRWSKAFPVTGGWMGQSHGAATDASNNLYLCGALSGPMDLGGGLLGSSGELDNFVASFTSAGQHRWSKAFGGAGGNSARRVAVDVNGTVYLTGDFAGTMDAGGGPIASAGGSDIFVASFTSTGQHRWSRGFGGSGADRGEGVALDRDGNVYVVGSFEGGVDFGSGARSSAGGRDVFVASFTSTGQHRWSMSSGGAGNDDGAGVTVGPDGSLYITGSFAGTVNLGAGPLISAGVTDIFLLVLAP